MLTKLLNKLGLADAIKSNDGAAGGEVRTQATRLVAEYVEQALADGSYRSRYKLDEYEAGRAIIALSREGLASVAVATCERGTKLADDMIARCNASNARDMYRESRVLHCLASDLLRQKLPFDECQIQSLLASLSGTSWLYSVPGAGCVRALEDYVKSHGLSTTLSSDLKAAIIRLDDDVSSAAHRKLLNRLMAVRDAGSVEVAIQLTRSENWSAAVLEFLEIAGHRRIAWARLLAHCATATASKPAKKWLKDAQSFVDDITPSEFRARLLDWFALVEKGGRNERPAGAMPGMRDEHLIMDSVNAQTLKGLVWCATLVGDDQVVRAVGRLGAACYRKIQWIGARSTAVANACVWALGAIPGREAVTQLSFLRSKSKYRAAKNSVEKALNAAAEREGVSAEDLEELAVPNFGMTDVGRRVEPMGDCAAELAVEDTHTVELKWKTAAGKFQKSIPAALKSDYAENIKQFKAMQKELQKLLPALRSRIEGCTLRQKRWTFTAWRERYLDHPLVGTLARRLIWKFADGGESTKAGIWHDGKLVDSDGLPLKELPDNSQVELWHPVGASTNEVVAWRHWLEQHEVTQPFKQAHREIYLLTDAERRTGTYSNRFAAHILRQHQFAALCVERGWRYRLQGNFDSANTPTIELVPWDIRVEFWVEPIATEDQTHMAIFSYVSSDQVRFYHLGDSEPVQLADVPPLVFTELMRDVDLFVGVASVGNDPNWTDGGANQGYRDYWQSYSFGDLSAAAKTRRDVLARLLPRLKIAGRCTLDEKYLLVRGDIRSYKIHLGSGNILMTPNDAYLCIVAGQGTAAKGSSKVFLPFEGDNVLSIILSKAFMLAEDTKIADRTIVNQICAR